ncbi:MAG TPA: endonuclease III [Armatimonadota bacterium]|nr:endonuclease III [Armatimonadota bacterium]
MARISEARIRRVDGLLAAEYGDRPRGDAEPDVVGALVRTVLSQNTSGANSSQAYRRLREAFPTWEDVLAATDAEVAEAIRPAGLAEIRAPRIRRILAEIRAAHGTVDLSWLRSRTCAESTAYLTGFVGVGAKTAACVVLFALGLPAFPVDTHVLRVAKRLGWVDPLCRAEEAQAVLERCVPDALKYRLHLNLVMHGRRRCRPLRPRCGGCPLRRFCRYDESKGGA